jgi:Protein of unknown function (DUF1570)
MPRHTPSRSLARITAADGTPPCVGRRAARYLLSGCLLIACLPAGCAEPSSPRAESSSTARTPPNAKPAASNSVESSGPQAPAPAVVSPDASKAAASALPAQLVLSTEPWTFGDRQGRTITTPNYRVFTTVDWPWLVDSMPAFVESAIRHYTTALGELERPERPLDTYLMANRPQWLDLCRSLLDSEDRTFEQIQRGGITLNGRAMLYNLGPRDTFALVAHEGWHQYTQTMFRETLPVWLEEGIATYMEGFRWDRARNLPVFLPWRNFERFEALRKAANSQRLIPLAELLNSTPQEQLARSDERALTYYAQVWALVHFMREGANGRYADALTDILRDARDARVTRHIADELGMQAARSATLRRRGPQLFQAYCNTDLAAAGAEYKAFIERAVRSGAGQRIAEGRSPIPE